MKNNLSLLLLLLVFQGYSQTPTNLFHTKAFSKANAQINGKTFLINNVFGGAKNSIEKFEIEAISSSSSSDITTLYYANNTKQIKGMLICFFSDYVVDNGLGYYGYSYKNLDINKSENLLKLIKEAIDSNKKYLKDDDQVNNIYFKFDDIDVLIYHYGANGFIIRFFWGKYDSTWDENSFSETLRYFDKKKK
jgi:hypothetical protein